VENTFADLNAFFTDSAVHAVNKSAGLLACPSAERAYIIRMFFMIAIHFDLLSRDFRA
jgi:hypothetical protein